MRQAKRVQQVGRAIAESLYVNAARRGGKDCYETLAEGRMVFRPSRPASSAHACSPPAEDGDACSRMCRSSAAFVACDTQAEPCTHTAHPPPWCVPPPPRCSPQV